MRRGRPRRSGAAALSAVVMVVAAGGCGGGDGADPPSDPDLPERAARIDLEIGSVEGPEETSFGNVGGVAVDGEGRIYVADRQAAAVRVFGPDGVLLHSIGRRGEGPGELLDPCCLAFDDGGRLWVRDGGNRRFALYRIHGPDSASSAGQELMTTSDANLFAPTTFRGDSVVVVGGRPDPEGAGFRMARAYQRRGGEGVRVEWVDRPTTEELGGRTVQRDNSLFYFWPPFGPQHRVAHGPGGWWADMRTDAYSVSLRTPDGAARIIERPTPEGAPASREERESMERRLEAARRMGVSFDMTDRKQPMKGLWFDRDGRLWVAPEEAEGTPGRADLYDTEGTLLERRRWPGAVDLSYIQWIRGDTALGLAVDSLGVQRVVRLVWE